MQKKFLLKSGCQTMLGISVALFIVAFCLWIIWRKRKFSVLKNMGIPGPEPSLFFGNLWEISKKTPLECQKEWLKKYGDVVGYYFGTLPMVLISDPELLKKIQISEFHNFINRPAIFPGSRRKPTPGDGFSSQLTNLRDKKWKAIRSILTPSFTASKMKSMVPIINEAIDILIEDIDEKAKQGESFDIYKMYQGLTMDVIGRTAFGIQTDCQRNPDDPLLRSTRVLVTWNPFSFLFIVVFSFTPLSFILEHVFRFYMLLGKRSAHPLKELISAAERVIKSRRENPSTKRQDLLQLMLDAEVTESKESKVTAQDLTAGDDNTEETKNESISETIRKSGKPLRHMNDGEILDNAVMFLMGGYDTTSAALAFTTHFLVHYPEIQERVREEVKVLVKSEGKLDYASVQKLQYLDQVLTESLRMYPPIYQFVNREVKEDVKLENFQLKKELTVQIPVYILQHDDRFWQDPETFDPERFSPENKGKNNPLTFQAFGAGPRNCLGIRFAQMQVKLALARILLKYKLVGCEETDKLKISLKVNAASITPGKGVYLKAVPLLHV